MYKCSMQKKMESLKSNEAISIPKNTVDYTAEVESKVDKILADFVEYRKHPNKERDTFNYTIFVTNYDVPNEDVVQRVAKEFKDAGYYVWVERSSRFGNGRLAVTERPKGPNTGNNYRMV